MSNYLCNGRTENNNPKSPIKFFEVVTAREYYGDIDDGTYIDEIKSVEDFLSNESRSYSEPFYQIYGIKSSELDYILLAEFNHIDQVKDYLYNLTGEIPQIVSY